MESDSTSQLIITANDRKFLIRANLIDDLTQAICAGLGLEDFEVSWSFVEAETMQELNKQYRDKDSTTDVLSFPQEEWAAPRTFSPPSWPLKKNSKSTKKPPKMLGDVIISPSDALANAEDIGQSLDREIGFLLVHGILHLSGHDHIVQDEERLMIAQQQAIMNFLEKIDDKPLWSHCCEVEV
ncbi:MAG: rRNA maturation RNase YbeY [Proteobacteria bacterium]|nr:rRNA maturation RNase YbeY [Pseudomonadota bacterium]